MDAAFAGALGLVAASPLEGGIGTRTMSSGSLVIVDKADPSAEHETRPQPASVSQTAGELPQEVEVRSCLSLIVTGHLSQCKVYDVAVGESDFQSAAMCTDHSPPLTCVGAALGTPHHVLSIDQC